MPIRFTATGDIDELKSLFNMVSAHADCLEIKTHALHKRKDLESGSQTFEISLKPARRYNARQEKPLRDTSGFVYLLRTNDADSLYKLGCSKDPASRRATFKTNFPVKNDYECLIYSSDMFALERQLHKLFAAKRVRGTEFFKLDEADLDHLRGLAA